MNQVQVVAPDFVAQVWSKVEHYLKNSVETGVNDCTVEQLKTLLMRGQQTLLVSVVDNEINGAMTLEVYSTPNERIAMITALGGRSVVDPDTFAQVEEWAKAQGATKVRAWAQEAQARLYRQNAGFNTTRLVVEKKL